MKARFLTYIVLPLALVLLLPAAASAQAFSISSETALASGATNDYISGYIQITNNTTEDLPLGISITSKSNLPADWLTQICFFLNCFPPALESVEGVLTPGETDVLDLTFMTGATPGTATVQITVTNLDNTSDFRILTFTATATVTNLSTLPGAASFSLAQNYPNPYSSGRSAGTTIGYVLPTSAHAVLKVYNLLGKEIRTLVNESRPAGRSTVVWDGRDHFGRLVSPGIYMYKLSAGKQSFSRRLSFTR